jgi:hypothetical protein
MYFDLWDLQSRNQLETFDTEEEALDAAAGYLEANAPDFAIFLSLGYRDDASGAGGVIAEGDALVERVARFRAGQGHPAA